MDNVRAEKADSHGPERSRCVKNLDRDAVSEIRGCICILIYMDMFNVHLNGINY